MEAVKKWRFWESHVLWLSLSILFTGASGLVYEYLLSTAASYIMGNSIEQFSITIAMMLLFMGIAGYWQTNISDKNLIEKFVLIEGFLSLIGGLCIIIVYFAFGRMVNYELVYYLLISLVGFLIGLEIPIVLRINERYVNKLKDNISFIYSADFIGSFIGALVWIYVLLKHFTLIQIGFITSMVNLVVAFITFMVFSDKISKVSKTILGIFLGSILVIDVFGLTFSKKIEPFLQKPLYKDPVIFHKHTLYQDIAITKNPKTGDIRLFINGNLQFSSLDERLYHEFLIHPVMSLSQSHRNVLILGGGDGLALREVLKYDDVDHVTLVDLDPEMIHIAKTYLAKLNNHSFDDPRVIVINEDAEKFVSKNQYKKRFDVVIIDLPDPSIIELNKLYSVEFYSKLHNILNKNGLIVIQSTSPWFAPKAFKCIKVTLEASGFKTLPYHYEIPSFGDWGFIIAYEPNTKVDVRSFKLKVDTHFLNKQLFIASLSFPKHWYQDKQVEVNSVLNPVLVKYYNYESWLTW